MASDHPSRLIAPALAAGIAVPYPIEGAGDVVGRDLHVLEVARAADETSLSTEQRTSSKPEGKTGNER